MNRFDPPLGNHPAPKKEEGKEGEEGEAKRKKGRREEYFARGGRKEEEEVGKLISESVLLICLSLRAFCKRKCSHLKIAL